jgi:hypothetical protein
MAMSQSITRRTVLRGIGTAMALPWLEAMAPAADITNAASGAAKSAAAARRIAFLYVPNGIHMQAWTPEAVGAKFTLPSTLEPLKPFQDDLLILTGLAQKNAAALGDGGGDHARSLSCFLTGVHPFKTDGANLRAGISVDQVAAERIGKFTRLSSLELGTERGAQSGNCDSGYSCAYSSNISWRSASMPMAKEVNPKLVFDRLFSNRSQKGSAADRLKREFYQKSIIDFVQEDAKQLRRKLGMTDRRKIDEYLTAVREIETRIDRANSQAAVPVGDHPRPAGIPDNYRDHIRLMFDLIALAFQSDVTRITTFMYANEGSNRSYAHIDVSEGHHELSHHGNDPKKHEKLKKINHFHVEQLAYLLGKLKSIREGEKSLLDNTTLVYGSGIGDGNRHNHDDLPILVAGRGGGTIKTGRHVEYKKGLPLNNLYLSILDNLGAPIDSLGDSTGKLPDLG